MNKYLEKVARMTSPLKAAVLNGAAGMGLGYIGKHKYNSDGRLVKKTKNERVAKALATGAILAGLGALHVHAKNLEEKAWQDYGRGATPKGNFMDHLREMGMGSTPKSKVEVHKYYKSQAMKYHPDRPTGDAKKMETLNAAYTKVKVHPDFEKLAQYNRYLQKIITH
jgi:hypothetical protein